MSKEKSPYLLQHAHNPVDWYPWSNEAFEKAKREDKPVFLSIGYSTCHWCHVMERECFEDGEVAQVLNSGYVAIKVDREERPDIDHTYMSVCQAMTGQGGWPLTALMTPEKKPFFAGTYFPKKARQGMPGLMDILTRVRDKWKQERDKFVSAGDQVARAIQYQTGMPSGDNPGKENLEDMLKKAFVQYKSQFDKQYGGFGTAPRFPTPHALSFLLRYWKRNGEKEALAMAEKTLESMFRGGIYDHIGYGFSRYSTDKKWLVPHFEKMLYDNALLAMAYTEAYQATGRELYARVAKEIFTYVLRDMHSPEGGFFSAEDADSEGEEGKFYVWSPSEIKEVLGEKDGEIFCRLYDITSHGNFEGRSIPNLIAQTPENAAGEFNMQAREFTDLTDRLRQKIFAAREKRVHPYKDDKILTAWNGLMIAALAKGAAVFGESVYSQAAERAVNFIYRKLKREDGRLLARYRDGEPAIPAFLDDYAFLAWGLLELYGATFEADYLGKSLALTKQMINLFQDKQNEGFYFNGADAEELITRPKEIYDGALPSGNSVALVNLLRLALLTGDNNLTELAEKQINAFANIVKEHPRGYAHFLIGAHFFLGPARGVVIAGEAGDPGVKRMLQAVRRQFLPDTVIIFHPAGDADQGIETLAPYTKEQRSIDGMATAYVCQNYTCQSPVTDFDKLSGMLI
ncbi:thioredoxin domain-containing protein [Pelotomaculum isophthalicicum JI]|uniref:Thioredoxin domain-containing protein n=1 Tax=Pelotomaculum isophthalicicum JI TaxID=947010 RepID=A0A9X4JUV8_9FIRM|nr:thioredoxin domain-containing protein [Pelotomaculum isophthalicicum]MDF9407031.1 thioredoxin domain-containing protein [Pelotomaculum isophthalicicum JI]